MERGCCPGAGLRWLAVPDWSTSEWASVLSTFLAAFAALAAWATVWAGWRQQRRARVPHVTGGLGVPPDGKAQLSVANAGPGFAVAAGFIGVAEGQAFGGMIGNGILAPGAESDQVLPVVLKKRSGQATFVIICRDVDNNAYLWAADGRSKRYSAKKVTKRKVPTKRHDLFHVMYPDTPLEEAAPPSAAGRSSGGTERS